MRTTAILVILFSLVLWENWDNNSNCINHTVHSDMCTKCGAVFNGK